MEKTEVHPIAGTRPRGNNNKEDLENEVDLLKDEKEIVNTLCYLIWEEMIWAE